MTNSWLLIGGLLAIIVAYPIVMRVLAEWMQPRRIEMAALGKRLLGHTDVTRERKDTIRSMLRDAYDFRVAIFMVLLVPFFAWDVARGKVDLGRVPPLEGDMDRFVTLHILSVAAANPLFFSVFLGEMMVFCAFSVPVQLLRGHRGADRLSEMLVYAAKTVDKRLGSGDPIGV